MVYRLQEKRQEKMLMKNHKTIGLFTTIGHQITTKVHHIVTKKHYNVT